MPPESALSPVKARCPRCRNLQEIPVATAPAAIAVAPAARPTRGDPVPNPTRRARCRLCGSEPLPTSAPSQAEAEVDAAPTPESSARPKRGDPASPPTPPPQ